MQKIAVVAVLGALGLVCAGQGARAETLITDAEAKMPASPDVSVTMRGLTRGPGIEQVSPNSGKAVTSPMPFKVKFDIRNKVEIDPSSIKLMYLKATPVDLTERIKKHITAEGIEMDDAEVPPGVHEMRLDLKDKRGRTGTAVIKFTVTGK